MEALHEEIYFNTLHFFDVMGRFTRGAGLAYPGRVIPLMHPKADGKPGRAKIIGHRLRRGAAVGGRRVRRARRTRAAKRGSTSRRSRSIGRRRWRRSCEPGSDGIERLDLRVKVDTEKDERDELVKRADERARRSHDDVGRAGRPRSSPTLHACALPASTGRARLSRSRQRARHRRAGSTRAKPARKSSRRSMPNGTPGAVAGHPQDGACPRRPPLRAGRSSSGTRRSRRPRPTRSSRRCRRSRKRPSTRSARAISARTSGRWT